MTSKIIAGVMAAVLLVTMAVFAAEKAKEKASAEKPGPKAKAGERLEQREGLLDQLAEAYKAKDREKMGEIIKKMQERREKIGKLAKLNKWHKWSHRRMMRQMRHGWGQGQQMAGPGRNRDCEMRGQDRNRGYPMTCPQCGQFQPMRGRRFGGCNNMMGNFGPMSGGFGQMPCQQDDMGTYMPQQGGPGQMPGWECGNFRKDSPGQDGDNMEPRGRNMPRREKNIPPPEWGW